MNPMYINPAYLADECGNTKTANSILIKKLAPKTASAFLFFRNTRNIPDNIASATKKLTTMLLVAPSSRNCVFHELCIHQAGTGISERKGAWPLDRKSVV